jgi:tocopherol O-methyltransferase
MAVIKSIDTVLHRTSVSSILPNAGNADGTVQGYYNCKTASILKKYGPGPRIHFHIGLLGPPLSGAADLTPADYRRVIVDSQEAMLSKAAAAWNARQSFAGRVLDAGCGLGGGSIFWAQECGSHVTAVTIADLHIPLIARFAEQAHVANLVTPMLCDACAVPALERYDAVVAMEASCYFPLHRWFARLSHLVRPGAVVCIEDTVLARPEFKTPFDAYWKTDIAGVQDYVEAARAAGFTYEQNIDLTDETAEFWRHSQAWSESVLKSEPLDAAEAKRLEESIRWHETFYQWWRQHAIEVRLLRFCYNG